jgi:hypothetical protein
MRHLRVLSLIVAVIPLIGWEWPWQQKEETRLERVTENMRRRYRQGCANMNDGKKCSEKQLDDYIQWRTEREAKQKDDGYPPLTWPDR